MAEYFCHDFIFVDIIDDHLLVAQMLHQAWAKHHPT